MLRLQDFVAAPLPAGGSRPVALPAVVGRGDRPGAADGGGRLVASRRVESRAADAGDAVFRIGSCRVDGRGHDAEEHSPRAETERSRVEAADSAGLRADRSTGTRKLTVRTLPARTAS